MKPTQVLEKSSSSAESFQTEVRGKQFSRRRVYMLVGAVVFVIVVGAVLLSVHFGMKMAKDSYKEYHANCIRDDGSVVLENIIMTDKEEIFSNDVATGIADMSTDLLTIKIKEAGPHFGKCYVTNFNFSEFQTPQEFIRTHKNSQITIETKNVTKRFYDVTDIWLNNKVLGTHSAELCEEKPAFFLRERTDITTRTDINEYASSISMFRFKFK